MAARAALEFVLKRAWDEGQARGLGYVASAAPVLSGALGIWGRSEAHWGNAGQQGRGQCRHQPPIDAVVDMRANGNLGMGMGGPWEQLGTEN